MSKSYYIVAKNDNSAFNMLYLQADPPGWVLSPAFADFFGLEDGAAVVHAIGARQGEYADLLDRAFPDKHTGTVFLAEISHTGHAQVRKDS